MDVLNQVVVDLAVALFGVALLFAVGFLKVKLQATKFAWLGDLAVGAAAYGEEMGARHIRNWGQKMPSAKKQAEAVQWLLERAPGVTREEAIQIIESKLPQVRLGAAGFLEATAQAIQPPK